MISLGVKCSTRPSLNAGTVCAMNMNRMKPTYASEHILAVQRIAKMNEERTGVFLSKIGKFAHWQIDSIRFHQKCLSQR